MILISRNQVPEPAILSKTFPDGKTETERAIDHYTNWDGNKQYGFTRYSETEVKDALEKLFHGKCAYCESNFRHIAPEDIEHWRPKGAVVLDDGTEQKPGYYWLAATWSNLLPSCIDCNRRRRQEDVRDPANAQSGKQNLFPVADEGHRWVKHDQANQNGEVPLLLDPCEDDPVDFIGVDDKGVVRELKPVGTPENDRARESIDVFGLNRSELVDERKKELALVKAICREIELNVRQVPFFPAGPIRTETIAAIETKLSELKAHQNEDSPYLLMKRPVINAFITRTKPDLVALGIVP